MVFDDHHHIKQIASEHIINAKGGVNLVKCKFEISPINFEADVYLKNWIDPKNVVVTKFPVTIN